MYSSGPYGALIVNSTSGFKLIVLFYTLHFYYYFKQIYKDNLPNPRIALANLGVLAMRWLFVKAAHFCELPDLAILQGRVIAVHALL